MRQVPTTWRSARQWPLIACGDKLTSKLPTTSRTSAMNHTRRSFATVATSTSSSIAAPLAWRALRLLRSVVPPTSCPAESSKTINHADCQRKGEREGEAAPRSARTGVYRLLCLVPCNYALFSTVGSAMTFTSVSQLKLRCVSVCASVCVYSTTPRNRNRLNRNHLKICLSSSQKNRKSLSWVLPTIHHPRSVFSRIAYTEFLIGISDS